MLRDLRRMYLHAYPPPLPLFFAGCAPRTKPRLLEANGARGAPYVSIRRASGAVSGRFDGLTAVLSGRAR